MSLATLRPRRAVPALFGALAACTPAAVPIAPVEPVTATATAELPAGAAPESAAARTAEPACAIGIWDAAANACGVPPAGDPGDPGAWAGCTQASGPQNARCFTGTHWVRSDCHCVCDGTTKWSREHRRCE